MFLGSLAFCLVCVKLRIDGEDPPDVLGIFFPFVFVGLAMAIKGWMHVRRARR